MDLSIVIPTKNEAEHLPVALAALHRELAGKIEYEVSVVDHGSEDDTVRLAREAGARVILCARAASISELRNKGAARAAAPMLAFIDADVALCPGWLDGFREAARVMEAEPNTLCGDLYGIGSDPSWIDRAWYDPALRPHARFIPAGNMVLSAAAFRRVGGFDVRLATGEDADLCRRIEAMGGVVHRLPSLVTDHLGNPDTIRGFMQREAWHGEGDFATLHTVRASKVALTTLAWLGLHILALAALPFAPAAALACWLAAVGLCTASAAAKYGVNAPLPARSLLYYAYFAGRSVSAWRGVRGTVRRAPDPARTAA